MATTMLMPTTFGQARCLIGAPQDCQQFAECDRPFDPAEYGSSGVMTFLVNHQGTVFEKDLGPNSARIAAGTTSFDPDSSWRKVANAGLPQAGTR